MLRITHVYMKCLGAALLHDGIHQMNAKRSYGVCQILFPFSTKLWIELHKYNLVLSVLRIKAKKEIWLRILKMLMSYTGTHNIMHHPFAFGFDTLYQRHQERTSDSFVFSSFLGFFFWFPYIFLLLYPSRLFIFNFCTVLGYVRVSFLWIAFYSSSSSSWFAFTRWI